MSTKIAPSKHRQAALDLDQAQQRLSLALLAKPTDKAAISAAAEAVRQAERKLLAADRVSDDRR